MYQLNTKISSSEIEALLEAHALLQQGCYFSDIESCLSGKLSTSYWIDDYYWNLLSSFKEEDNSFLIEKSKPCFDKKQRKQAFYIDPTSKPSDIADYLQNIGFTLEKEVWMSPTRQLASTKATDIEIVPVDESNKDDFLRVFSIAFGGEATEADGYGDIPPSYLNALRDSISGKSAPNVKHFHFIGHHSGTAVACGSIHIGDKYAGLYNVGTLSEHQQQGIGTAISLHAIEIAQDKNVDRIFFQTQPGGTVQRFYEGLGCEVIFEAAIAYQE
jgi:ribosomal protein S18 acetylase RimI-like enzyme